MAQSQDNNTDSGADATPTSKRASSKKSGAGRSPDEPANAITFGTAAPRDAASGGGVRIHPAAKGDRLRRGKKPDKLREEPPKQATGIGARSEPVPDAVRERFIQIGGNFFFPDGTEAFTDHGNRVTTRSENAIVIQSMVAIAQARSAHTVTVSGTDFFRREAWFAARLAGLDVLGYAPTALEQERLVRAVARRRVAEKEDDGRVPA